MAKNYSKIDSKTPKKMEGRPEAKIILRKVVDDVYKNAWEASERGELVGWSSSKFPVEFAKAFDLNVVYPENHAATVAAKHDGLRLCQTAEDMGFDNDICGYARISLAFAAGEPSDARLMPQPDFLLCCNNICNCMTKWYENIARIKNIPLIMIDVPFSNEDEPPQEKVDYLLGQFQYAIKQLEQISGKKFNEEKFNDACTKANRTAAAWLKACSYMGYEPSPLSGFDLFNHMADIVAARCEDDAAIGFEYLAEEFEESIKDGTSTWKYPEDHRVLFEGIPCWPNLRELFEPLKSNGINVTAVVYAPAFGFRYNNIQELAKAYCKAPCSVCIETGVEWRETMAKENGIDGVLVNYNRSCKPWSGAMPEMERRFRKDLDVPVVHFDGDQADERNFSVEQYKTRVEGLTEIMDERKAQREAEGKAVFTNFENTTKTNWEESLHE